MCFPCFPFPVKARDLKIPRLSSKLKPNVAKQVNPRAMSDRELLTRRFSFTGSSEFYPPASLDSDCCQGRGLD